jgi:hypothetical protein
MTTFPLDWYGNPNATPASQSNYTNYVYCVYSWNPSWNAVATFSGTTVTNGTLNNGSKGTPGTGSLITFTTTGTLPTPLLAGVTYYARKLTSSTYELYNTKQESYLGINKISFTGGTATTTAYVSMSTNIVNNIIQSTDSSKLADGAININSRLIPTISTNIVVGYGGVGVFTFGTSNKVSQSSVIDTNYKPVSLAVNSGTYVGNYMDASGRPFKSLPSIGAYEDYSLKNPINTR